MFNISFCLINSYICINEILYDQLNSMKIYCLFLFFLPKILRNQCVLESNNEETIYLCFFHSFGDMIFEWNIQLSHVRFAGWLIKWWFSTSTISIDDWTIHYVWWLTIIFFSLGSHFIYTCLVQGCTATSSLSFFCFLLFYVM